MKRILFLLFPLLIICIDSTACTTAIVSGKYTKDGRPLIFKHRDSGTLDNKVMYIDGERYSFLAVVNANDAKGDTIWMGTNSAGFSIMNSASYNLNVGDTTDTKDLEGSVMRRALGICATLEDFEYFLDTLARPMGLSTNLGVIDSYGGAAYYETDNNGYVKFDANDQTVAPFGYLIRTNYSNTGTRDDGYGYIRYMTTSELFYEAEAMNKVSDKFILTEVSRCLKNSLTEVDYMENYPDDDNKPVFVPGIDLTMRSSSASTFLCKGVQNGEDPALNTMWLILGYQLCAPAIPLWVNAKNSFPELLKANIDEKAPLCTAALTLKNEIYPIKRGNGLDYINLAKIINKKGTGIYQKIRPMEDEIFKKADTAINDFYENGFKQSKVQEFYNWINDFVKQYYEREFGLEL